MTLEETIGRHEKIALHLSGGKDSVACLYVMRDFLSKITVYHLDTGDEPQETKDVLDKCRSIAPNYVVVQTDSKAWIAKNGYPSDVVPTSSSYLGLMMGFGELKLSDRFSCCWNNVMLPMYERMKADGITLIIRGQKLVDMPKVPMKSGQSIGGIEVLYPLECWSNEDVFRYLKEVGAPVHDVYGTLPDGVDCMHCTAWWEKKSVDWLKIRHPDAHYFVSTKHAEIKQAISSQMSGFDA